MSDQTELQAIALYLDRLDNREDGDFLRGIAAKLAAAVEDAAAEREKVKMLRRVLNDYMEMRSRHRRGKEQK